jgi:hypothetical protein
MTRPILILAALVATVTACSVDRRSEQFACTEPTDCEAGRRCIEGWCVLGTDGPIVDGPPGADDASSDAPTDAFQCPPACTRCDGDVCVFECTEPNSCSTRIVCPPGVACHVRCSGAAACAGGVDCASATTCQIQCATEGTCRGALLCGDGPCNISCSGAGSCIAGVNCESSCSCSVTCQGSNSCSPAAACPADACRAGSGCKTDPSAACNTCP